MISYLPCEWQPRKGQAKKSLPALGLRDILRGVPRRMLIRRVLRGMLRGRAPRRMPRCMPRWVRIFFTGFTGTRSVRRSEHRSHLSSLLLQM